MHLLSTLEAATADVEAAVDLGQSPGEIVILSAADSELACLAAAQARLPADAPSLRLANLLQLAHPMSVDLYVEQVVARARLVVAAPARRARLLALWGRAGGGGLRRAWDGPGLPAGRRPAPDPELAGLSTLPADDAGAAVGAIWSRRRRQRRAGPALRGGAARPRRRWAEPRPLPRPGSTVRPAGADATAAACRPERGHGAVLVFYRALLQSGDLAPSTRCCWSWRRWGSRDWACTCASLKDGGGAAAGRGAIAAAAAGRGAQRHRLRGRRADGGRIRWPPPTRPCCR